MIDKGLIVLSLFDGISCGQLALKKAGIKVNKYFASEIKDKAIETTMIHFPNTIQIGDVTKVSYKNGILYTENGEYNIGKIDLLIGGSPCQNFSSANIIDRRGLEGDKSKLFYEYLRLKKEINPKYFLLENVKMTKENESKLSEYMGVNGIHINSQLLSYQKRPRIYWTNINQGNIPQPIDKNIFFKDYIDNYIPRCEEAKVNKTPSRIKMWNNGLGQNGLGTCANITNANKIGCLTRKQDRSPNSGLIKYKNFCRFLTRKELEMAQTLPIGYLDNLSFNQVQDVTGDGWTVDVIAYIFGFLN